MLTRVNKFTKSITLLIAMLALFSGIFLYSQSDQPPLLGRSNVFGGKFNYTIFGSEAGYHVGSFGATADWAGTKTLAAGSGTVTFTQPFVVAPVCVTSDQTANASTRAAVSTTALTITGTGTDVIGYICIGQPN